jgi:hypothetical protein
VVSFTPRPLTSGEKAAGTCCDLGGPCCRSAHYRGEINIEPQFLGRPTRSLVTILATLSRLIYVLVLSNIWGTRWRSWLRHCATSREVAGSIPDGVTGIFHLHNPFGRTMPLGLGRLLTEMSTRNISWVGGGQRRPVSRADNLTCFMCRLSWNLGASTCWYPQGLSRPVMGLIYPYLTDHSPFDVAYLNSVVE